MQRRHSGILVCTLLSMLCATSTTGMAAVLEPKEVDEAGLRALVEEKELPFEEFWIKLAKGGALSGNAMNTRVGGSWEVKGDSLLIKAEKSFSYPDREGRIKQAFETSYSGARLLGDDMLYFAQSETVDKFRGVEGGDFSKKELAKLRRELAGKSKEYDVIFEMGKSGSTRRTGLQLIAGGDDKQLHGRAAALLEEAARKYDLVVVDGGRAKNTRKSTEVHIHDPKLAEQEVEERCVPWTLQLALLAVDPGTNPKVKVWKKRGYLATVVTGAGGSKPSQASVTRAIQMIERAKAPIDRALGAKGIAALLDHGLDLKQGLTSKNAQVRQIVSAGIALRPDKAAPYRQALVKGLDTDDLPRLVSTVEILGRLGHKFEPAVLVKAARGFDELELMKDTARAFAAVGPAAVVPALDAIFSVDINSNHKHRVQEQAIVGIAAMGEAAIAPLTEVMEKSGGDMSRRAIAIRWMAHAGPKAAPKLCEWLEMKDSPIDKVDIMRAMVELAHQHPETHATLRASAQKFSEHKWAPIAKQARFVLNATKPR